MQENITGQSIVYNELPDCTMHTFVIVHIHCNKFKKYKFINYFQQKSYNTSNNSFKWPDSKVTACRILRWNFGIQFIK